MFEVDWSLNVGQQWNNESLINHLNPEIDLFTSLAKETSKTRKNETFRRCPAHTDFMKNTYVLRSPMDLNLEISIQDEGKKVYSENLNQEWFDLIVDTRFLEDGEKGQSDYPVLGLDFLCSFMVKESILLQVFPAFMHYNDFTSKTTVIPGEFDIFKWVRPVELVFECKNPVTKINIKKGDALSYFKFQTDEVVKVNKSSIPWKEIAICDKLRADNPWKPLKERYNSYQEIKDNDKNI